MQRQMRALALMVSTYVWIAGGVASAQTLSVTYPTASVVTPPLSQLPDAPKPTGNTEHAHRPVPSHAGSGGGTDSAVQTSLGPLISATAGITFDGPGANGYAPSDNNIAVGPNHIFAAVNSVYQIFTKTGASVLGPKSLSSLWSGVGGGCATANAGDVVVQYDKLADRWILTQLSSLSSPYGECIAVSTSGDPTSTYKAYYYSFGTSLPDYPKFGVWPTATNSAYMASYNQFANGSTFAGAALCAYDRAAMLAGATSPAQICFTIANDGSYLPADLDGSTPPLDGTPAPFLTYETLSSLRIWNLAPNFATPAASTLTLVSPDLGVTAFSELCGGGTCVPQTGTTNQLDSLADRPMYRLAYRNFGHHQAMVFNHSVTSGVRWYELRAAVSATAPYSVYQQGTYAPDATYRWMGSAAMDQAGDLAVGYSASSSSIHPAVRYSGRVPSDTLGTLESEGSIIEGTGSQTNGLHRWGDYSSLRIDPSDDCTFWYINQYLKADGAFNWSTRIGAFKFSSCGSTSSTPDFTIAVSPSSQSVNQGTPASYTVTVTSLNSFNSAVTFSVNCPAGATCAFTPPSATPAANGSVQSTLTVNNAPLGTSSLTVHGSAGTLNHDTAAVSLTVNTPNFSLSANPTSVSITQGSVANSTITVTSTFGYSQPVTLSVTSGCPTGATCSFNPNPVTPPANGSSTSGLSVTGAPLGTYTLTIRGTDGTLTHTTSVSLTVNPAAGDFTISVPASVTVTRKTNKTVTVTLTAATTSSSVTLSVSGVPGMVTTSFTPNPATASGTSAFKITVNKNAKVGSYPLTITGTNSAFSHTAGLTLFIN
jgi:hypothetical protein